jgi:hypothetical protein
MKIRYLALMHAVLLLCAVSAFAQGPKELSVAAGRPWHSYSNTEGFSIALPDFFKQGMISTAGTVQYQPADARYNGIVLFVSRVGNSSPQVLQDRYKQLLISLKHQDETKIDDKHLTNTGYVVSSHAFDDDQLDEHGKEQKLFWYQKGMVTPAGVYEISIRYQPEYRKAVTAIIPRILASFDRSIVTR